MTTLAPLPVGGATRVVYLGTPEIAVPPLRALVKAGCNVQLVITRPDVRRARGPKTSPSPVKLAAQELGIRVSESLDDLVTFVGKQDLLGVVVAYGALIPINILRVVPMINVHFSLLPRWRGAAPVERALLAGDEKTGVCIMRVVEGLDQGEVYACSEVAIHESDTLDSLRSKLVVESMPLLVSAVVNGCGVGTAQTGEVSYAKKISPHELRIDWTRSAKDIHRLIRIGDAYTTLTGKRIKITRAELANGLSGLNGLTGKQMPGSISTVSASQCLVATGSGLISLIEVQPEGKSPMRIDNWLNGARINSGTLFS